MSEYVDTKFETYFVTLIIAHNCKKYPANYTFKKPVLHFTNHPYGSKK